MWPTGWSTISAGAPTCCTADVAGGGRISVEVVVAWPELQAVVPLTLPDGASVADAVEVSGLRERFPELEVRDDRLGVFGEKRAPDAKLADGDRVEIYRPLKIDPKDARRIAAQSRKGNSENRR